MREKIIQVMAELLDVDSSELTGNPNRDTVNHWDSLRHMNLILALEEEFNVQFSDQQIHELNSLDKIEQALTALRS